MPLTPEQLAEKFHETYEALAPSFRYGTHQPLTKSWAELPETERKLLVSICEAIIDDVRPSMTVEEYFARAHAFDDPALASDRNSWQRRLGVLITRIESFVARARHEGVAPVDCETLLDDTYRAVNADPRSGHIDEPLADVAAITVRHTLESAIASGLVVPGPNAPPWMK